MNQLEKRLVLRPGREKSLRRRHWWIFSGAVREVTGEPAAGDVVEVYSSGGEWLARAGFSPASQLQARIWTFDRSEAVDDDFFRRRLLRAIAYRRALSFNRPTDGYRLVASEADALPGLIVDRYADWLVVQFLSAGMEPFRRRLVDLLLELLPEIRGIYDRSDVGVRAKEALPETTGVLAGATVPEQVVITENNLRFAVDIRHGHKSGFYFDQRCNRQAVAEAAKGAEMLNLFAYTGGFGVAAAAAGAAFVTNVDSSAPALALAERNFALNGIPADRYENIVDDVFELLRRCRRQKRQFDLIVLDPPKFVDSQKALARGCRAYKDVALQSFHLLKPGGRLFTFSCSGLMTPELFQKITADAALDAGIEGVIVRRLGQAPDHPTALNQPEGFYLKGLEVYRTR